MERLVGLDLLRGVAIILVLSRHGFDSSILNYAGWAGVDLFFVLSGFLVGGMLFDNYHKAGTIYINRFLVHRSFKILLPFYVFITVLVTLKLIFRDDFYDTNHLLSEIFFVRTNFPGIWIHTWTLSVEVQFYIVAAFLLSWSANAGMLNKRVLMLGCLITVWILVIALRLFVIWRNQDNNDLFYFESQLRGEGIIIGIILAYLRYFTNAPQKFVKYKIPVLVTGATLISPLFVFAGGSFFMNTAGQTLVNIGFGLLVVFASIPNPFSVARWSGIFQFPFNWLCFIGKSSYSIYIWHLTALSATVSLHIPNQILQHLCFLFISLAFGVFFYKAVEIPGLKIRSRFLASMSA